MIKNWRFKHRLRWLVRHLGNTKLVMVLQPGYKPEDPVYFELDSKIVLALLLDERVIRVYIHPKAHPYVSAYMIAVITKLGTLDVRGTLAIAGPEKKPGKLLHIVKPTKD
jgi:hypothetical protein